MNLLVAKHKETGSEVLLVDPVIGESFIKFLNKENAETPILISKEEFVKYLDVIKSNMVLVDWWKTKKQLDTPIQQKLYRDMCNWCSNELKLTELDLNALEKLYYDTYYILSYFDNEDYEIYIS